MKEMKRKQGKQIWLKTVRGKANSQSGEKRSKSQGPPHWEQCRHVCDRPGNQMQAPKPPSSQNRQILPSSWFGRVLAYSIQLARAAPSVSHREQIVIFHLKYTRCTDLMSSVKWICYHQLLGKGFQNGWAFDRSVGFVLRVCAQRVAVLDNRQTRPLPLLVTVSIWFCHLWLQKCLPRALFWVFQSPPCSG